MKALSFFTLIALIYALLGVSPQALESPVWANAAKKIPKPSAQQQRLFRRGMDAYEAKKFEDAIDVFSQILQKQSDYTPAKIQLARSLYQLKRFPEAYKLFKSVDLDLLEPEASYEYGQTAFRANDFAAAVQTFRNVPNGHPLYDLAGYYGGISAFKIGNYQLAVEMLEQAVVLPSKLVRSHKLYQKEAEKQLIIQQKQELQASTPPAASSSGSSAGSSQTLHESAPPYRYLQAKTGLSLIPSFVSQTQSLASGPAEQREIKRGELRASAGLLRPVSRNSSTQYLVQLNLIGKALEGASGEVGILPDPLQETELALIQRTARVRSLGTAAFRTGIEWPFAEGSTLGLQLGSYLTGANGEFKAGYTTPWMGIFLGQKNPRLETSIKVDAYLRIQDNETLFLNTRQFGRVAFSLPADFEVGIQGELAQYSYNIDRIDGPDWFGRIVAELGYARGDDVQAFVGSFFELQQAQRLHDLPDASVVEFDANTIGGFLRAEVRLLSWLQLGVLGQVVQRSYGNLAPSRALVDPILKEIYPVSIEHVDVHTTFSTSF